MDLLHGVREMNRFGFVVFAALLFTLGGCRAESLKDMHEAFDPLVCIVNGPLSSTARGCWHLDLPFDARSSTGYAIPSTLHDAFNQLDTALEKKMKGRLEHLYEEEARQSSDKMICIRDPYCSDHIVGELEAILTKAWDLGRCSPLVKGLRNKGVAANPNLSSVILAMYADSRLHPTKRGPYVQFLMDQKLKADEEAGARFLKERGFVPGVNDEVRCD
jgi:hypothetical protein